MCVRPSSATDASDGLLFDFDTLDEDERELCEDGGGRGRDLREPIHHWSRSNVDRESQDEARLAYDVNWS